MEPEISRFDFLCNDESVFLIPNYVPDRLKIFYEKYWLSNDTNFYLNAEKSKLALEYICLKNNVKFFSGSITNYMPYIDLARDLGHAGIKSNILCAEKILNEL